MSEKITFDYSSQSLNLFVDESEEKVLQSGNIQVQDFQLSAKKITPGSSFLVHARIAGENIAHIYAVAYLVQGDFAYGPVYQQFCLAPNSKTIRGVTYPKWEDEIVISHEMTIELPLLQQNRQVSFGFAIPQEYGEDLEKQQVQLPGWYHQFGKEERSRARLSFDAGGKLLSIVASSEKKPSPVRKVTPKSGDSFIPLVRRIKPVDGLVSTNADEFVFADELALDWNMKRTKQPAMEGEYVAGLLIEDLDGHRFRQAQRILIDAMAV
jgi:hypothetical protein